MAVREHDCQDPPGYLSIREVNAGHHTIYRLAPLHSLSTPFEVEAGKAVYLGEVHVRISGCDSLPARVFIEVTDQWERDGRLFQQRVKNLRSEDVVKSVLTNQSLAD